MSGKMKYGRVPFVEKQLSRVVFGNTGDMSVNKDCFELLDAAFAAGVNVFDTAASYGEAEAVLGRWIQARNNRDEVVILTKGANPNKYRSRLTEHDILSDIEDSFAKLQTDYIDIYILHRDDPTVPVGPIAELLNKLHKSGRIGAFGGSNWTLERTKEAISYAESRGIVPFSVCSPSYSLAECIGDPWGGSVTVSGKKNIDFRNWLLEKNVPVFAYSSLARGFLSGKLKSSVTDRKEAERVVSWGTLEEYGFPVNYERLARAEKLAAEKGVLVSQIAFAWLMRQPQNIFGVTSAKTERHIQQTADALDLNLSERELLWLNLETD